MVSPQRKKYFMIAEGTLTPPLTVPSPTSSPEENVWNSPLRKGSLSRQEFLNKPFVRSRAASTPNHMLDAHLAHFAQQQLSLDPPGLAESPITSSSSIWASPQLESEKKYRSLSIAMGLGDVLQDFEDEQGRSRSKSFSFVDDPISAPVMPNSADVSVIWNLPRVNSADFSRPLWDRSSPSPMRRHSVATVQTRTRLSESVKLVPQDLKEIDDYFENTEHRTKAFVEAGRNLAMSLPAHPWPLYVVEFKAGRTDFFYCTEEIQIQVGDLVIVEADRGKDLGKVICDTIYSTEDIHKYQATHVDPLVDSHGKTVEPKQLYALASPEDVSMLLCKSQDEAKAMALCQVKIRQKKLPMEVVDAEYQWDRRKLTFYFVSESRIDFRELVRELFKIYKTRIWMCAVSPQ